MRRPARDTPAPDDRTAVDRTAGDRAQAVDRTAGDRAQAVEAVRSLARVARLMERASDEVSMAHYRVLAAVDAGAERASRVAERLELGRPTVSAAVEALCREGLLARVDAPDDQRAVDLRLTPAGRALLARVEAAMVARLDDLCDRLPTGPAVRSALAELGNAVDQRQAERLRQHRVGQR